MKDIAIFSNGHENATIREKYREINASDDWNVRMREYEITNVIIDSVDMFLCDKLSEP
jgi:hypothetical protein